MLHRNVLRVQVHQPAHHALEPLIRIVPAQIAVAGIEVDADGRALHEIVDAIQAVGMLAVLLVRLDADPDAARLGHQSRLLERVAHEHEILVLGRPRLLGAFIGVDDGRAAFGREPRRLFEIFGADLRAAQRRVRRQTRAFDSGLLAGPLDAIGVIEHGDAVKVSGLRQQFPSPMHHGLDIFVAELGGLLHAPLERLVRVANEFHVHAEKHLAHMTSAVKWGVPHHPYRVNSQRVGLAPPSVAVHQCGQAISAGETGQPRGEKAPRRGRRIEPERARSTRRALGFARGPNGETMNDE
jgi:hypothetical protein